MPFPLTLYPHLRVHSSTASTVKCDIKNDTEKVASQINLNATLSYSHRLQRV
jgi:hypothetical protein